MNVLGKNVKAALKVFNVPQENIIVLHDDLEQKLGKFRIVKGTSFKGHNGLKSISQELGGYKDFIRIGIGIGRPENRDQKDVSSYVLSNFKTEEIQLLEDQVFKEILGCMKEQKFTPETIQPQGVKKKDLKKRQQNPNKI